jgi:hypothetical protein
MGEFFDRALYDLARGDEVQAAGHSRPVACPVLRRVQM